MSELLPGLRVPNIQQTTIRDWLISLLSSRTRIGDKYATLEHGLRGSPETLAKGVTVARLKGSLGMAHALERHAELMRRQFTNSVSDTSVNGRVLVKATRLRQIIRESKREPLNEQRKRIESRLEAEVRRALHLPAAASLSGGIIDAFNQSWPELDFRSEYAKLCSNREKLTKVGGGIFSDSEVELLVGSVKPQQTAFANEDLGPLAYLDHLLNNRLNIKRRGRITPGFEHVIIDEVQDVTPLELLLVRKHSSNGSFTLLGDPEQSPTAFDAASIWREAEGVFSNETLGRFALSVSYRATHEITTFSRHIFVSFAPRQRAPKCYDRHGEKPVLTRSKSYAGMMDAAAQDIVSLLDGGMTTIAVLCKTASEAMVVRRHLFPEDIGERPTLRTLSSEREKITVAAIYEVKGLEYDAVIMLNTRKQHYRNSVVDNRLLYMGSTRAAHRLHIHYYGTLAEALPRPVMRRRLKRTTNHAGLEG